MKSYGIHGHFQVFSFVHCPLIANFVGKGTNLRGGALSCSFKVQRLHKGENIIFVDIRKHAGPLR